MHDSPLHKLESSTITEVHTSDHATDRLHVLPGVIQENMKDRRWVRGPICLFSVSLLPCVPRKNSGERA